MRFTSLEGKKNSMKQGVKPEQEFYATDSTQRTVMNFTFLELNT
jgi:hypothetical protein